MRNTTYKNLNLFSVEASSEQFGLLYTSLLGLQKILVDINAIECLKFQEWLSTK